jgi:hypothetical protein
MMVEKTIGTFYEHISSHIQTLCGLSNMLNMIENHKATTSPPCFLFLGSWVSFFFSCWTFFDVLFRCEKMVQFYFWVLFVLNFFNLVVIQWDFRIQY